MCVVNVFYCVDCRSYSRVPFRDPKSLEPVTIVTNVFCFQPACARRSQVFSPVGLKTQLSHQCFYPGCTEDTCRIEVVPKSCLAGWYGESQSFWPVQAVIRMAGNFIKLG